MAERPQLFYATLIGRDPGSRLAFVSKSNPAKVVRQGLFLTPKRDVLTRIEDDVFLFEDRVDMIVSPDRVVAFNQPAFEQWFRDTPALQGRVKDWIGGIAEHLPARGRRRRAARGALPDEFTLAASPLQHPGAGPPQGRVDRPDPPVRTPTGSRRLRPDQERQVSCSTTPIRPRSSSC